MSDSEEARAWALSALSCWASISLWCLMVANSSALILASSSFLVFSRSASLCFWASVALWSLSISVYLANSIAICLSSYYWASFCFCSHCDCILSVFFSLFSCFSLALSMASSLCLAIASSSCFVKASWVLAASDAALLASNFSRSFWLSSLIFCFSALTFACLAVLTA